MMDLFLKYALPFLGSLINIAINFAIIGGIIYFLFFRYSGWKKFKTLDEYWALYPHCKTENGPKCFNCSSKNIRQTTYKGSNSRRRVHYCNQCNMGLYRSEW